MTNAIAIQGIYNEEHKLIGLRIREAEGQHREAEAPLEQILKLINSGELAVKNLVRNANGNYIIDNDLLKTSKPVETAQKTQVENTDRNNLDYKITRRAYLTDELNKARKVYEQGTDELMTNFEYDKLYDELMSIEKEIGALKNSPTQNVGYEVVSSLQKEKFDTPMLSLNKTKEVEDIRSFLGDKEGVASWKMDGLTVVIYYNNGKLVKAVTRGNGEVGEIVTHNARVFKNLPKEIEFKGNLVLRGEAIIKYSDFNKINDSLPAGVEKYKTARNLCSGSVRQLNAKIAASRNINWYAFELVSADGKSPKAVDLSFEWLRKLGFETVEYFVVNSSNLLSIMSNFESRVKTFDIPSDGLVFTYNDVAYGKSLGRTSKFPRSGIAFKWEDAENETELFNIAWQVGKTGIITPVAEFNPIIIDGTEVARASLHNISILRQVLGRPYIGEKIKVYKANMIIPNISWGDKGEPKKPGDRLLIPDCCPCCGEETEIRVEESSGVETLYCTNPDCSAKMGRKFKHFVSRDAMNIDGMSSATLDRFTEEGYIETFADIYHLDEHEDDIINLDGFGEKSFEKMINAIEKSRNVKPANLLYALSIPNVGLSTAKLICKHFNNNIKSIVTSTYAELASIEGVGDTIAGNFIDYFQDETNAQNFVDLYKELNVDETTSSTGTAMNGVTICVTGDVYRFSSRRVIKDVVEELGGKLTGSVSRSTSYLVTNDTTSGSRKNKAAQEYGIPILTEDEFIEKFGLTEYIR